MKRIITRGSAILLLLISATAMAQLSLNGDITPRTELRNGFKKPLVNNQSPALFTEQRTRLHLGYNTEKYEVKIAIQDIRIWGATAQIYKSDPAMLNLYEGWGRYKLTSNTSIKAGRMTLNYDNARFLGDLSWSMQGRPHDGLLFETKSDSSGNTLHAGVYFNQDANTPEYAKLTGTQYNNFDINGNPLNYKAMMFVWFNKKMSDKTSFSLLAHNNVTNTPTGTNLAMQTFGGVGKFGLTEKTRIATELYYQTGIGSDLKVAAYYGDVHLETKLGKLTLTPGLEYLSGDNTNDGTNQAFNPLYGTNHKFNGYMDYFYLGNSHSNVGLINPYLKTTTKVSKKSSFEANLHGFMAAIDIDNSYLGTELDLVFISKLTEDVIFKVGHSFMNATDTMKTIKDSAPKQQSLNTWSWAQLIFTPKFL